MYRETWREMDVFRVLSNAYIMYCRNKKKGHAEECLAQSTRNAFP